MCVCGGGIFVLQIVVRDVNVDVDAASAEVTWSIFFIHSSERLLWSLSSDKLVQLCFFFISLLLLLLLLLLFFSFVASLSLLPVTGMSVSISNKNLTAAETSYFTGSTTLQQYNR